MMGLLSEDDKKKVFIEAICSMHNKVFEAVMSAEVEKAIALRHTLNSLAEVLSIDKDEHVATDAAFEYATRLALTILGAEEEVKIAIVNAVLLRPKSDEDWDAIGKIMDKYSGDDADTTEKADEIIKQLDDDVFKK